MRVYLAEVDMHPLASKLNSTWGVEPDPMKDDSPYLRIYTVGDKLGAEVYIDRQNRQNFEMKLTAPNLEVTRNTREGLTDLNFPWQYISVGDTVPVSDFTAQLKKYARIMQFVQRNSRKDVMGNTLITFGLEDLADLDLLPGGGDPQLLGQAGVPALPGIQGPGDFPPGSQPDWVSLKHGPEVMDQYLNPLYQAVQTSKGFVVQVNKQHKFVFVRMDNANAPMWGGGNMWAYQDTMPRSQVETGVPQEQIMELVRAQLVDSMEKGEEIDFQITQLVDYQDVNLPYLDIMTHYQPQIGN